jgi:hypothetical protein
MNSFQTCQAVEQESLFRLHPWLQYKTDGHYVITHKGPLAKLLQEQCGDVLMNDAAGSLWAIECKAERENAHGNFFFESWSNKSQFNPGWLWKIQADLLLYHFLNDERQDDKNEVYVMRLDELRAWAFETESTGRWRITRWKEKRQDKYEQLNDTWGFCVPIQAVLAGVKSARRVRLHTEHGKATNSAALLSARGNGDLSTAQR